MGAEACERLVDIVVAVGELRPDQGRTTHRVAGGLVFEHGAGDLEGVVVVGDVERCRDVEELTGGDLHPHAAEIVARQIDVRMGTGVEHLRAPHQEHVTEEDGGRGAEHVLRSASAALRVQRLVLAVCGGFAATGVRVVDEVVVDQCRDVEDVE